jgi:hypothetical protein
MATPMSKMGKDIFAQPLQTLTAAGQRYVWAPLLRRHSLHMYEVAAKRFHPSSVFAQIRKTHSRT